MKPSASVVSHSTGQIFRMPLWIGLFSAVGLIGALLGDEWWDAVSWLALTIPLWVTYRKLSAAIKSRD